MTASLSRPVIEHAKALSPLKARGVTELVNTVLIRIQPTDKKVFKPLNRVFSHEHLFHMTDTNAPGARGLPTADDAQALVAILLKARETGAKVVVMGNRPFALSGAVMRAAADVGFEAEGFEAYANRTLYGEMSVLIRELDIMADLPLSGPATTRTNAFQRTAIPSMVCN